MIASAFAAARARSGRAIEELVTDAESRPFNFDDRLGIIAADSVAADLKVDHSEATRAVRVTADC